MKACKICGKRFEPNTGRQMTCNEECSQANRRNHIKKWQKEHPNYLTEYGREYRKKRQRHFDKLMREKGFNE